jgi:hypothetical protein
VPHKGQGKRPAALPRPYLRRRDRVTILVPAIRRDINRLDFRLGYPVPGFIDDVHGRGLGPHLPHHFFKAYLGADFEPIPVVVQRRCPLEVNLASLGRFDKSIPRLFEEANDKSGRDIVVLDVQALAPGKLFELSLHGFKGIGKHPIQRVVQAVMLRPRIDDEIVSRWHAHLQPHPIRIAASLVFVRLFDGHAAARDMGMKLLQLSRLIPDQFIEVLGLLNVPKT